MLFLKLVQFTFDVRSQMTNGLKMIADRRLTGFKRKSLSPIFANRNKRIE